MNSGAFGCALGGAACPLCEGMQSRVIGTSANGPVVRCAECTLTYHPTLLCADTQQVEPYYGDDEDYDAYRRRKEPEWEDLFARLRRYVRGGRLLDVGCARGYSTAVARRLGFDACGIEISAADARYAQEQVGVQVHVGTVEKAGFADGSFDAAVLWSVLEHLTAPAATIAAIARILRPGGILNIFTPNAGSKAACEQGVAWIEYNRPGHAVLFSPTTVRRLLQRHRFEPLDVYTTLWARPSQSDSRESRAERRGCALAQWCMRPGLAPVRRRIRQLISALAPQAASQGEYMGVYARKA